MIIQRTLTIFVFESIYDCWIGGGDDSSLSASASTKPNRVAEELYYSATSSTTIDLQILALPAISLLLLNVRLHGVGFEFNCFDSRAPDKVIHISLGILRRAFQ